MTGDVGFLVGAALTAGAAKVKAWRADRASFAQGYTAAMRDCEQKHRAEREGGG